MYQNYELNAHIYSVFYFKEAKFYQGKSFIKLSHDRHIIFVEIIGLMVDLPKISWNKVYILRDTNTNKFFVAENTLSQMSSD